MNNLNKELISRLQEMNKQSMNNLMRQFHLKNANRKSQGNLKKNNAELSNFLKSQLPTTNNSTGTPNTQLSDLLSKLFNK